MQNGKDKRNTSWSRVHFSHCIIFTRHTYACPVCLSTSRLELGWTHFRQWRVLLPKKVSSSSVAESRHRKRSIKLVFFSFFKVEVGWHFTFDISALVCMSIYNMQYRPWRRAGAQMPFPNQMATGLPAPNPLISSTKMS